MASPKHKNIKLKNIVILKKIVFQIQTVTNSVLDFIYFRGKVSDLIPFLSDAHRAELPYEFLHSPMELDGGTIVINLHTN